MYVTKISASRMDCYITCSFKYFLTYCVYVCDDCGEYTFVSELKHMCISLSQKRCLNPLCNSNRLSKLKLKSSWGAVQGSIIHKVLELYANACMEQAPKDDYRWDYRKNFIAACLGQLPDEYFNDVVGLALDKYMNKLRNEFDCDECDIVCEEYRELCVEKFVKCPYWIYSQSLGILEYAISKYDKLYKKDCLTTEQEFNIDLNEDVSINGYIDAVFQDDDCIEGVDYKTGAFTQKYEELLNDNQAKIYNLALKHMYPDNSVLLTFDYFQGSPVSVSFDNKDDEQIKKSVLDVYYRISSDTFPRRIPLCKDGKLSYKCRYMCDRPICDGVYATYKQRYGSWGL